MAEQQPKKTNNTIYGVLFIILGLISIGARFMRSSGGEWRTVDYVKIAVGVVALGYGVYLLLVKKKSS